MSTHESKSNSNFRILLNGVRGYLNFKVVSILICLSILIVGFIFSAIIPPKYTEITDIADYGIYSGTCADSFVSKYITSFFPEEISPSFHNIRYSYKAENTDTYGFEAYLEFTIEDEAEFRDYVSRITRKYTEQEFLFHPDFLECDIENVMALDLDDDDDPSSIFYRQILSAKIRKILYSYKTQTIIYIAMGVHDGGGIGTNYLNAFFERFQIDPAEYVRTADSEYGIDPFGID